MLDNYTERFFCPVNGKMKTKGMSSLEGVYKSKLVLEKKLLLKKG